MTLQLIIQLVIAAAGIFGGGVSAYLGVRVGMARIEAKADTAKESALEAHRRIDRHLEAPMLGTRTVPLRR